MPGSLSPRSSRVRSSDRLVHAPAIAREDLQVNLNSERVDALVVGAGPAGSVLAALLAREGWRVLIVDAGQGPARRAGETLAGAARVPLEELGQVGRASCRESV